MKIFGKWSVVMMAVLGLNVSTVSAQVAAPVVHTMGADKFSSISDGAVALKLSFFQNVPNEVLTAIHARYKNQDDPDLSTSVNTFLIQTAGHTILVDAGAGGCMGDTVGHTLKGLAQLNIDPESVTEVLLTHAHGDHICGLVKNDPSNPDKKIPVYSKAKIYLTTDEYNAWVKEGESNIVSQVLGAYKAHNPESIQLFTAGDKLLSSIQTFGSEGHTAGHVSYLWVDARANSWMFVGDLLHNAELQFAHPEVAIKFDQNSEQAIMTRKTMLDFATQNKWRVAGAHLPFPGIGYVKKGAKEDTYSWEPLK